MRRDRRGALVHVTMLALGSRGDVQPLIAFGHGLQGVGHEVRIATYPRFESFVRGQGIDFAPLAEGALSLGVGTAEGRRWQRRGSSRLPTWVGFIRDARSVARRRLKDGAAACQGTDVVVATNLSQVLGWQLADHLGVPLVRVLLNAPTYWMSRRRARRTAAAIRQVAWLAARPWLNAVRREALGLRALPLREPFGQLERRGALALAPFSPAAFPRPRGWGDALEVTGYWFLDGTLDPDPPAALVEFLAAGPAPVYVGFGTQIDPDPVATTRRIVDALERAGRRGVLLRGPAALAGVTLPPEVIAVEAVSHAWLFPRCAAVVHHAAAGTIASCLRAGRTSVPVPHNTDQFSWARELHRIGVGTSPIPRRRLTSERLEAAIRNATTDEHMQRRATEIRDAIAVEDGVARAVEAFQRRVAANAPERPSCDAPTTRPVTVPGRLTKRRVAAPGEVTLPNGLVVEAPNPGEATFLYAEIFRRGAYLRHGIGLADGATVLDIGANIGLFAVAAAQQNAQLRLLLFEPVPSTFAILERNAARLLSDADVTLRCAGMAATPGQIMLDVDPRWSLDAGLDNRDFTAAARGRAGIEAWTHALMHDAERSGSLSATGAARLRRALRNPVARPAALGIVALATRLRTAQRRRESRRVLCEMTTISAALRDHDVDVVDLVKIDVEGAEWEVLQGIEDSDWSRLRQLVIEVHDIEGRLGRIEDLLRSNGYVVTTEQEDWALLRLMGVWMLYARRP